MRRAILTALVIAVLLPDAGRAVPRPRAPRVDPRHTSATPSYVQRVEPAIVGLKVRAAPGAASSARLGAHRFVSGVIYDARGYALTVSYGLLDAVRIEASMRDNRVVPAQVVGLDLDSGLGVVKLDGPGPWPAATLGDSRDVARGDITGTVGVDEDNDLVYVAGHVHAIQKFSAYWEYMLERALFIAPSSSSWGGSAVVDVKGSLIGMASLRLGDEPYVNLAIPLERFVPVKDELVSAGRVVSRRPRPWLGLYTTAHEGGVEVEGFAARGPALTAGFQRGDRIVRVNGVDVASQEAFYEQLWRGQAGDEIVVAVRRRDRVHEIRVRSVDRQALIAPPQP
jgi:S1-C subfamily serine protease